MRFIKIKKRRRTNLKESRSSTQANTGAFQRNRTITGATSNQVNDTGGVKQPTLMSSRTHTHHLANKRRKLSHIFLVVALAAAISWGLISNFTASPIVGSGDSDLREPISVDVYQDSIQSYLDAHPMERLRFLLDEASLTSYVTRELPEVSKVKQVGRGSIGKTQFTVKMRLPVAGWEIGGEQYYVDSSGVPFKKNYFQDPAVNIVDESGIPPGSSDAIASNRLLSFVGRVVSASKDNGYTVVEAALPEGTTRQLDIKIQDINYRVKLYIDRPAGEQIEDMSRAVKYLNDKGIRPQYLDVRVSGKAFYR